MSGIESLTQLQAFTLVPLGLRYLSRFLWKGGWEPIPVRYLEIFDVPWAKAEEPTQVLKLANVLEDDAKRQLLALPAPTFRCFRFYVAENMECMQHLWARVTATSSAAPTGSGSHDLDSSSFTRLRSQWKCHSSSRAWLSSSFGMVPPPADRRSTDERHYTSLSFSGSLIKLSKRIRIFKDSNECILGMLCQKSFKAQLIAVSFHCKLLRKGTVRELCRRQVQR